MATKVVGKTGRLVPVENDSAKAFGRFKPGPEGAFNFDATNRDLALRNAPLTRKSRTPEYDPVSQGV